MENDKCLKKWKVSYSVSNAIYSDNRIFSIYFDAETLKDLDMEIKDHMREEHNLSRGAEWWTIKSIEEMLPDRLGIMADTIHDNLQSIVMAINTK